LTKHLDYSIVPVSGRASTVKYGYRAIRVGLSSQSEISRTAVDARKGKSAKVVLYNDLQQVVCRNKKSTTAYFGKKDGFIVKPPVDMKVRRI